MINLKLILPILSLLIFLPNVDARFWTNKEGKTFEGELVEVKDNAITIRRTRDRIKFTVNAADLSQGDQDYLKELDEKKKAEELTSKNKTKSSKVALPKTKEDFAVWLVGTEWGMPLLTIATEQKGRRTLRFHTDEKVQYQFGVLEWQKNLKFSETQYTVLTENSLLWGGLGWTIVFDKRFKTFKGISADKKMECTGVLVERFMQF